MSSSDNRTDQFAATNKFEDDERHTQAPDSPTPASSFDSQGPTPITPNTISSDSPTRESRQPESAAAENGEDAPLLKKADLTPSETPSYTPQPNLEEGLKPRISVIGVGGAGCNAITNMINSELAGVEFFVANTDAQALEQSNAKRKIQLGLEATHGLGAGSHPEMGRASAEESIHDVLKQVGGSHMLFVTAGMGGGTGTGAAPVIAKAARENGILTVGVVTKPFHFEGAKRMRTAEAGIEELQKYVDTLIVIPNQNLFRVANEKTTFVDAFKMADEVLYSGVRSVTDLMMKPGLINLDFADVKAVMGEMMGKAMMGTGEAEGEGRAIDAAEAAISSPLLDDVSMKGAKAVLINITGGMDMTLFEADEAANRIRDEVDPNAHIIFGSTFDESLEGKIRVSCVATGIDAHSVVAASVSSPMRHERREQPVQPDQTASAPSSQAESLGIGHRVNPADELSDEPRETYKQPQVSSVEKELGFSLDEDDSETTEQGPQSESTYDIYSSLRKDMNQDAHVNEPATQNSPLNSPRGHDNLLSQSETESEEPSSLFQSRHSNPQPVEEQRDQSQIEKRLFRSSQEVNTEQPPQTSSPDDEEEHRGFFSRLMGRKKSTPKVGTVPERKLAPPPTGSRGLQSSRQASPNEQEDLDVPAFLRRKDRH